MLAFYLFLFVTGGGLVALSLMGDVFGGTELDVDLDLDVSGGLEMDAGSIWKAFSLMGVIYGVLGAGATGTLLHLLWDGEQATLTALLAAGSGFASGGIATVLMNYLKRSGSGDVVPEKSFEGLAASVTLPIRVAAPGSIRVQRGHRAHVLRALPYDTSDLEGGPPESWTRVIVVEVRNGVAYVTPSGPELDRLTP